MNRTRLYAATAVGILLLAGAGFVIERADSPPAAPASSQAEKYPIPPPNVAVTVAPSAEAEPSMAISPKDHDTIVVGANDFNTLNGDKWDGYYTTHDRGKT